MRLRPARRLLVEHQQQTFQRALECGVAAQHSILERDLVRIVLRTASVEPVRTQHIDRPAEVASSQLHVVIDIGPQRRHHDRTTPSARARSNSLDEA